MRCMEPIKHKCLKGSTSFHPYSCNPLSFNPVLFDPVFCQNQVDKLTPRSVVIVSYQVPRTVEAWSNDYIANIIDPILQKIKVGVKW